MKEPDDKLSNFERLVSDDTTNLFDSSPGSRDNESTSLQELVGGTIDGKFKIVGLIGTGGLSAVYEAFQEDMGRRVAIKILLPQWSSDAIQVKRFRREAQILSQLSHANIASVHSCGLTDKNELYLTMEFVDGTTLDRFLAKRRLTSVECNELFQSIAEAIAFAHGQGIIHRDLKPQNIMITSAPGERDIQPKVLDFGIAKMFSEQANQKLTATGAVVGSPVYMAPEQFTGRSSGASADIYSFGCVLYHALAGQPPFVLDTVFAYMSAHLNDAPQEILEPPGKENDPLRRSLIAIAFRCMAKNPDERFASMEEVCLALNQVHDSPTISVNYGRLPGVKVKAKSGLITRRNASWALLGLCSIALAVGLGKSDFFQSMVNVKSKSPEISPGELVRQANQFYDQADHEGNRVARLNFRHLAEEKYRAAIKSSRFSSSRNTENRNLRCMLAHCLREMTDEPKKLKEAKLLFEGLLADDLPRLQQYKDESSRINVANAIVDIYQSLGTLHLVLDKDYKAAEVFFKKAQALEASFGEYDFGPLWGLELSYRYQKRPKEAEQMALKNLDILRYRFLDEWYRGLLLADIVVDLKTARGWTLAQSKKFVEEQFLRDARFTHTFRRNRAALDEMEKALPPGSQFETRPAHELSSQALGFSNKPRDSY